MEKLTLKEIAGYFPHKLKGKYKNCQFNFNSEIISISSVLNELSDDYGRRFNTENFTPYLYPLEMLTTNDEKFDLYLDLCEELGMIRCDSLLESLQSRNYYALDIQKYSILEEWMNKNHFDWKYDLIKRGLAIDKSTLNCK